MSGAAWWVRTAGLTSAVLGLAGCNSICYFAPCDSQTAVAITNDCGYDVEVSAELADSGKPRFAAEVIAAGGTADVAPGYGPVDVWIRSPEAEEWTIQIPWQEVASAEINSAGNFTVALSGDRCPN